MAFTKTVAIQWVVVFPDNSLRVDRLITVFEDGVEITKQRKAKLYPVGSDISSEPASVRALAEFLWA